MYYGLLATDLETSGSVSHVEVKALRLTAQPPPFPTIRRLPGTLKGHLKQDIANKKYTNEENAALIDGRRDGFPV